MIKKRGIDERYTFKLNEEGYNAYYPIWEKFGHRMKENYTKLFFGTLKLQDSKIRDNVGNIPAEGKNIMKRLKLHFEILETN